MPIITSLLDNDLYKLTMQQAIFHYYPDVSGESRFVCRGQGVDLCPIFDEIRTEIACLKTLRFSKNELVWLRQQDVFQPDYLTFLAGFSLNPEFVQLSVNAACTGGVEITVKGPWLHITLFEIFILSITSEVYGRYIQKKYNTFLAIGRERLHEKITFLKQQIRKDVSFSAFKLMEFGTRRRFSRCWQREVLEELVDGLGSTFVGTSNMYFAQQMDIPALGTMGHEWLQAHQALVSPLEYSQREALSEWLQEYQGKLGIALTDTINLNAFLNDFDRVFATAYQGVRHDSGDPILWGEAVLSHYQNFGINPKGKTLVFSDSLDFKKALVIFRHFSQRTNIIFGIGTWLTHDTGLPPLRIVQKLVRCDGHPVAKLSDTPGKTFCVDDMFLARLKRAYGLQC